MVICLKKKNGMIVDRNRVPLRQDREDALPQGKDYRWQIMTIVICFNIHSKKLQNTASRHNDDPYRFGPHIATRMRSMPSFARRYTSHTLRFTARVVLSPGFHPACRSSLTPFLSVCG